MVYPLLAQDKKVYFVRKGEFINQIPFDIQKCNKYPTGRTKWEMIVTTMKMLRTFETLNLGAIFGHREFFLYLPRKTQVQAKVSSKVYYITWDTYLNCMLC